MQFCQPHWEALRAAIRARGLDHFVAPGGAAMVDRVTSGDFEPLLGAHNAIVQNAVSFAGLEVMDANDDGSERCPLCFLVARCGCTAKQPGPCDFERWVDRAADDQLAAAKERGLLG